MREEKSRPPESIATTPPDKRLRLCKHCAASARKGSCRSSLDAIRRRACRKTKKKMFCTNIPPTPQPIPKPLANSTTRHCRTRRPHISVPCAGHIFCSMKIIEDVRKYAAEQGSRRERSVEKGNKRKVPRIDGEGQRGLREGVIFRCFCPRHKRWKIF